MQRAVRQRWTTVAQAMAAVAAFVALAVYPPAEGFLLVVPLTTATAAAAPGVALGGGATLIARGPWPGSLVVHGRRDRMTVPAGMLILAAPEAICGGGSRAA